MAQSLMYTNRSAAHRARISGALLLLLMSATACSSQATQRQASTEFGRLVERLSGPGAYFDTDNLISNEASYLHVMDALEVRGVTGGAYLGVGPDQNFSYIAQVRPEIAIILDIRRDNLMQHLLFKALFELAEGRIEYLCLLFARPFPDAGDNWRERSIEDLVAYLEQTSTLPGRSNEVQSIVLTSMKQFGVVLSDPDLETIERMHRAFISAGPDLRFASHNRAPRWYYPTYKELLLERDLSGDHANYLASEDDFQFLKALQERGLIIPVVGDFAGEHALVAIGDYLREREDRVTAFYTSNVEFYLMRGGSFDRFAQNVTSLPYHENGVIIRSLFRVTHEQSVSGYYSTQLLQGLGDFVSEFESGGFGTYRDLVNKHVIDNSVVGSRR